MIDLLFLHKNTHRDTSNEYPQHMFSWRNKKIHVLSGYPLLSGAMDTQNMFWCKIIKKSNDLKMCLSGADKVL